MKQSESSELKELCLSKLHELHTEESTRRKLGELLIESDRKYTAQELADMLGLAKSTVVSSLSTFRKTFYIDSDLKGGVRRYTITKLREEVCRTRALHMLLNSVFRPSDVIGGESA